MCEFSVDAWKLLSQHSWFQRTIIGHDHEWRPYSKWYKITYKTKYITNYSITRFKRDKLHLHAVFAFHLNKLLRAHTMCSFCSIVGSHRYAWPSHRRWFIINSSAFSVSINMYTNCSLHRTNWRPIYLKFSTPSSSLRRRRTGAHPILVLFDRFGQRIHLFCANSSVFRLCLCASMHTRTHLNG